MSAQNLDLVIEQGKTFTRVIRWESSVLAWKAISAIAQVAPVLITAVGHGVPDGWKVGITNVTGMTDLNAKHTPPWDDEFKPATYVGVDEISINDVSAAGFDPYLAGGYVVYYVPVSLATMTARMKIKDQVGGAVLVSLATPVAAGSGFTIDDTNKTITLTISADDTAAFTWLNGVYDLEMVDSSDGSVTAILSGNVTVTDEVTTA